jgi:hypothetical protein
MAWEKDGMKISIDIDKTLLCGYITSNHAVCL